MRAPLRLLLALAPLLAPGLARGQWREVPMRIPLDAPGTLAVGPIASGAGNDALLVPAAAGSAPLLRPWRELLARPAPGRALPASRAWVAAGFLGPRAPGALADVALPAPGGVEVDFGSAPGLVRAFAPFPDTPDSVSFVHLLPRGGDVLVGPAAWFEYGRGRIEALDLGPAGIAERHTWTVLDLAADLDPTAAGTLFVQPLRLSPTARAEGLDDLALAGVGEVILLLHDAPPVAGAGLAGLRMRAVDVGNEGSSASAAWLPDVAPGVRMSQGIVLGAAPLDVDGDGALDLVLSLGVWLPRDVRGPSGLVWIRNTGSLADLGDRTRKWQDLGVHPDLQLAWPMTLRPIEVGGAPALALYDRGAAAGEGRVVVVSSAGRGRLAAWRGATLGLEVRDLHLADLAGSPAPDLVGVAFAYSGDTLGSAPVRHTLLVWPDLGDASPEIAWAPGSPGAASRGLDRELAVEARDADGPFTVEWLLSSDPEASPAGAGPVFTVGGAALCDAGADLPLLVRATDALGVFAEVEGTLDVVLAAPALDLVGATPPGRLALPPGGAAATFAGEAWTGCGRPVAFTWGGTLPAAAPRTVTSGPTDTTLAVLLPEATYPALLAGAPEVTLAAVDDLGLESPVATLPLALDAGGLVEVAHAADREMLALGEPAVLRTTLRSRLGVALPGVRVRDLLAGLAPAGAPRVLGAAVAAVEEGGATLVLEALPPSGTEVSIELPVRGLGRQGASAVEVRSEGGHLLTPPAAAAAPGPALPGCGCGGSGAEGAAALLALLALARRRRPT